VNYCTPSKATLSDVCELITDGTHFSPTSFEAGDFMYLTSKNVREGRLDLTDLSYVSRAVHETIFSGCPVRLGDVLYVKDGANTGLAAINTIDQPFSMLSSVALIRPKQDKIDARYLAHWLNSPLGRAQMLQNMSGAAIKRLVLGQIRQTSVPLLPVPPFPRRIEVLDMENFLRTHLSNTVVMWPDQSLPLLGYMCCPNDEAARDVHLQVLRSWPDDSEPGRPRIPDSLGRIQADWLKVADIFHCYCDLIEGQHQQRRGGPSIGKAITLVASSAQGWGTGEANLWKLWAAYKDVAHLVTAATLICAEVRHRFGGRRPGSAGLRPTQFVPFQMTMLMPGLVLAVAIEFERHGLGIASDVCTVPALDPDTLWRIPPDINVTQLPPPFRKLRPQDIAVLNNRRAGNRGRANRTTPVSG
jgi:hypothetical protein